MPFFITPDNQGGFFFSREQAEEVRFVADTPHVEGASLNFLSGIVDEAQRVLILLNELD